MEVKKKGILILPKKLREEAGISEGDEVIVEVEKGKLIMKVLKPRVVDVNPHLAEKLVREEYELEKRGHEKMFYDGKTSSRH